MENIIVKKRTVSNLYELLSSVKETLSFCKDTQIFISNELFKRLLHQDKHNIIWQEKVSDSFHYSDDVEQAFIFRTSVNKKETVFQMHFVKNCLGYCK